MPLLEKNFHLIAPDYPGFGQSDSPARDEFPYTFDHLADALNQLKVYGHRGLGGF